MTAEESISLMALHGLAQFGSNSEEVAKYKWIGGSIGGEELGEDGGRRVDPQSFSNMYYKILNGKLYMPFMDQFGIKDSMLFLGDAEGDQKANGLAEML